MSEIKYKRILLKVSGEALAGEEGHGLDFTVLHDVCASIKECVDMGVQVGLVIGGGNFWRGIKNGTGKMQRSHADSMGMLATVMNAIAVADVLEQHGIAAVVQNALDIQKVSESYNRVNAVRHLEQGTVVIFAGGSGCPFFSTDTAAALRAAEIDADAILLAKNVDGVYDADPNKVATAKKFDRISYAEVLSRDLKVMDNTATALAMNTKMPLLVFGLKDPANIKRVLMGEAIGTYVGFDA